MKKVLILAYDFPPYVSVGGLRPYNWLKYLPEYGVQPIVITRNWKSNFGNALDYVTASDSDVVEVNKEERGLVIRTPYHPNLSNRLLLKYGEKRFRFVRKALTAWSEISQFLWMTGTKKELYYAAEEYLMDNKVDAIIATGDPFVLFAFASKLSDKFDVPWIADYRDLWSQFASTHKLSLLKKLDAYFEKKSVRSASAITTVSALLQNSLATLFPEHLIEVMPNGYDPESIDVASSIQQSTERLTISFVGSIYPWHAWRSFILEFSRILESNGFDIDLNFIGVNIGEEIKDFVSNLPQKSRRSIHVHPKMQNEDLLPLLAKHNVLLLFNYYAFMGTKIYDYIGVNRQIIFCYTDDEESNRLKEELYPLNVSAVIIDTLQADLIEEKNAGVLVENLAALENAILNLVQEFEQHKSIRSSVVNKEDLSRKGQVEKLAQLIHQIQ